MVDGRVSVTKLAKELGVSTKTIVRWEKAGKIRPAKRDWRGWRVYSAEEVAGMKEVVQAVY